MTLKTQQDNFTLPPSSVLEFGYQDQKKSICIILTTSLRPEGWRGGSYLGIQIINYLHLPVIILKSDDWCDWPDWESKRQTWAAIKNCLLLEKWIQKFFVMKILNASFDLVYVDVKVRWLRQDSFGLMNGFLISKSMNLARKSMVKGSMNLPPRAGWQSPVQTDIIFDHSTSRMKSLPTI